MKRITKTGFLSYAQADTPLVDRFLELLRPRLATHQLVDVRLWSDQEIVTGQDWRATLEGELGRADFGLLCVSANFLVSRFVSEVEIPWFLAPGRVVVPFALEPLDLAQWALHGLAEVQIFRYRPKGSRCLLSFAECGGVNRLRFCDALVTDVQQRLAADMARP